MLDLVKKVKSQRGKLQLEDIKTMADRHGLKPRTLQNRLRSGKYSSLEEAATTPLKKCPPGIRQKAIEQHQHTYNGSACPRCGSTLKYITGTCVNRHRH